MARRPPISRRSKSFFNRYKRRIWFGNHCFISTWQIAQIENRCADRLTNVLIKYFDDHQESIVHLK